jgi:hypothetical protein
MWIKTFDSKAELIEGSQAPLSIPNILGHLESHSQSYRPAPDAVNVLLTGRSTLSSPGIRLLCFPVSKNVAAKDL